MSEILCVNIRSVFTPSGSVWYHLNVYRSRLISDVRLQERDSRIGLGTLPCQSQACTRYHIITIAPPQLLECSTSQWQNEQIKFQLHLYKRQPTQQSNQRKERQKPKNTLGRKGNLIEPGIKQGSTLVSLFSHGESLWSWRGWRVIPKWLFFFLTGTFIFLLWMFQ